MDSAVHDLIVRLHAGAHSCVLCVTGGGAGLAAWLLAVPGASRSVLEVVVPYHQQSLADFLGWVPDSYCSVETTQALARRAWERASWLAPGESVAGVACTAALRSDRPRKGDHRFHLAIRTATRAETASLTLHKDARSRLEEEETLDRVLLNLLAAALGLEGSVPVLLLPGEEIVARQEETRERGSLSAFLAREIPAVCVEPDGRIGPDAPWPAVLLPGSFNPLHHGHLLLAEEAARTFAGPVAFELTVVNADKPPLSEGEVRRRARQLAWRYPLWLTWAPTYALKARLFPGAVFVVGADTAVRIVQPHFYGGVEEMARALGELRAAGCRFLVAGRVDGAGYFRQLEDVGIPGELCDLFSALPTFRADVSSSQLRSVR